MKKIKSKIGQGGDGGEVFIIAKKITGDGKIKASGGNGSIGGNGGKVVLISEDNQFSGEISSNGGQSYFKNKWWEKSWVQFIFLLSAILGIIGFIFYIKN